MGRPVSRPIYRRSMDLVVVRPIKLSKSTTLQPGTEISSRGKVKVEKEVPVYEDQETGNEIEVDGEMVPEVKSVQVGTETVETELTIRMFLVRAWYARRRVGQKGDKWTKSMLASIGTSRANFHPELVGDGSPEPTSEPEPDEGTVLKGDNGSWSIQGHEGEYKTKKAAEAAWAAYQEDLKEQANPIASEESKGKDLPPEAQSDSETESESQPEKDAEDEAWD